MPNVMHHCCLVLYKKNSSYFGVNEIISFQKSIGNLDKMTVANLGGQHQRTLDCTPISRVLESICICLEL